MNEFKDPIAFDDFAKLDLRVARVTHAEHHPNADRLFKIQLDDGSEEGRQVCAGIRPWYAPEDLIGRDVIIVANLEPRKIRGEMSRGMLLAASHLTKPDDEQSEREVVVLTPMKPLPPGSTVS